MFYNTLYRENLILSNRGKTALRAEVDGGFLLFMFPRSFSFSHVHSLSYSYLESRSVFLLLRWKFLDLFRRFWSSFRMFAMCKLDRVWKCISSSHQQLILHTAALRISSKTWIATFVFSVLKLLCEFVCLIRRCLCSSEFEERCALIFACWFHFFVFDIYFLLICSLSRSHQKIRNFLTAIFFVGVKNSRFHPEEKDRESNNSKHILSFVFHPSILISCVVFGYQITPDDLEIEPKELDFGSVYLTEGRALRVWIQNRSSLPQRFGFTSLPREILISPDRWLRTCFIRFYCCSSRFPPFFLSRDGSFYVLICCSSLFLFLLGFHHAEKMERLETSCLERENMWMLFSLLFLRPCTIFRFSALLERLERYFSF